MAKAAEFETPELTEFIEVPNLVEDTMKHVTCFVAKPDHNTDLGFPGEKLENWKEVAIDKMGDLLSRYRGLQVFMDACVKCGSCTDKCHYYIGTKDPKNMPVGRQDLLRKVYRRYFTFAGKYFPKLVGAADLTDEVIDEWYSYFHQCSSAVAVRSSVPTASIPPRSPWRRGRSSTPSVWARSTATRSSARCHKDR